MSRVALPGLLLGLAGLLLAVGPGCAHTQAALPPPSDPPVPPAVIPEDPPPPHLQPPIKPAKADVPQERRPQNILALSGGGANGAFTAGVLNGWTRTDKRPEFDVVTGVSTGALIAPLAFLGPKYDAEMKKAYTEIRQRDVFAVRAWATVPFRDAVASSAPLRRMIESAVTDEVIAAVAAEHKKGRRLYVGTTQLETRKTVVWDLGAIAARGGRDVRRQVCDILVASCSIPGVFPPVPIAIEEDGKTKTELHVDGGVTTTVFVPPQVLEAAKPAQPGAPVANLYVIVAGKYYPEAAPVRPRVIRVLKASGGALMRAYTRRDLSNIYHMAKLAGVAYHSVALRSDFPGDEVGLEFDQALMSKLFAEGVKVGLDGPAWDATPPERAPGEADEIRTGSRLKSRGKD